jgi:hypothetical protein
VPEGPGGAADQTAVTRISGGWRCSENADPRLFRNAVPGIFVRLANYKTSVPVGWRTAGRRGPGELAE